MARFDLAGVLALDTDRQCDEVLRSRPTARDSRVHWWVELLDDVAREFDRHDPPPELLGLALRLLTRAEQDGDLSPVDVVVQLAWLRRHTADLTPDDIAARALDAVPLTPAEAMAVAAREREFLLTDDRAWYPSTPQFEDAEFDALDDLRRILDVLAGLESHIGDNTLRDRVATCLATTPSFQFGPEVTARGQELLARWKVEAEFLPE